MQQNIKKAHINDLNSQIERKERFMKKMETQQKQFDKLAQFSKEMQAEEEHKISAPPGMLAQDEGTFAIWSNATLLKNTMSNKDEHPEKQTAFQPSLLINYASDRNDNNHAGMITKSTADFIKSRRN